MNPKILSTVLRSYLALLGCLFALNLSAQEAPEKPTPPFLKEPEIPARITREFSKPKPANASPDESAAPGILVHRTITDLYPNFRRALFFYTGKSDPGEYWVADGVMIGPHPNSPRHIYMDPGAQSPGGTDLKPVYPEAKWVAEANFVEWDEIGGVRCRKHFMIVPPTMIPNDFGPPTPNDNVISGPVTVWIADATRRPIRAETTREIIELTYGEAPMPAPEIPVSIQTALKSLRYGPAGQMR